MQQKYSVEAKELGIKISTGSLAKLANGSVTIQKGETSVLVTATMARNVSATQSFFPLTVDYKEKFSAAGRFPGGYIKREGRPSEKEILTSRLCDRPLRPLFPKGFLNEVQIIGMLLSTDLCNEPDILMVNGASAALMCSDIPWAGPIGCVRIAEVEGEFIVNPTNDQIFSSHLDLIYVGNKTDTLMIEGSADQLSEERFLEALALAHKEIQPIIEAQEELAKMIGKKKRAFSSLDIEEELKTQCTEFAEEKLRAACFISNQDERKEATEGIKNDFLQSAKENSPEVEGLELKVNLLFDSLCEKIYRSEILHNGKRIGERPCNKLREITCQTDVLPCVHGSSVFERGETQNLVTTTLGTSKDAQDLDALTGGAQSKSFILHYNFPPFSVGETGRFGFTSRREIGHGALAERSLLPVIPSEENFPYSIRLVSETLSSNGSTSMASICGGTLALMDAGVPIVAPVAGISIGLVTESNADNQIENYTLLTDILGSEDHYGDMDFKIAGTENGVTGFQLDLKIAGLPFNILKEAVYQNKEARLEILSLIKKEIAAPRPELKKYSPQVKIIQINPDKIGALIGPGGKTIKKLVELTGSQIDINEDNSGKVTIYSRDKDTLEKTINEINAITKDIEVGKTYRGIVRSIKDFGVFVECLPGKEGMVHVSELSKTAVRHPKDVCKLGEQMLVKCIGVDEKGRVRLSKKAAYFSPKNKAGA